MDYKSQHAPRCDRARRDALFCPFERANGGAARGGRECACARAAAVGGGRRYGTGRRGVEVRPGWDGTAASARGEEASAGRMGSVLSRGSAEAEREAADWRFPPLRRAAASPASLTGRPGSSAGPRVPEALGLPEVFGPFSHSFSLPAAESPTSRRASSGPGCEGDHSAAVTRCCGRKKSFSLAVRGAERGARQYENGTFSVFLMKAQTGRYNASS